MVARWIGLHRRVVILGGTVAMWVAIVCLAVVGGVLPAVAGLVADRGGPGPVPDPAGHRGADHGPAAPPAAVGGVAARGRGAATLSTALNSNTLNVVAGLLLPGALIGLGAPSGQAGLITVWYAALTLAVLALAYRHRGLSRRSGLLIIAAYAVFAVSVVAST